MFLGGELDVTGPLEAGICILKKFRECFCCGDIVDVHDEWKAEGGIVGGDGRRFGDITRREVGEICRSRRFSSGA